MKDLKQSSLEILLHRQNDVIMMTWIGKSEERNPSALLKPYLNALLEELENKSLVIDYTQLDYMNSSTVAPIVQFINHLNKKQVNTIIYYNSAYKWQEASFKALKTLSESMPYITVKAK